jgi:hypothetical protein
VNELKGPVEVHSLCDESSTEPTAKSMRSMETNGEKVQPAVCTEQKK